jgi:hypothetical protein
MNIKERRKDANKIGTINIPKHDCEKYKRTFYKWNKRIDDYTPNADVCMLCGKVLHED